MALAAVALTVVSVARPGVGAEPVLEAPVAAPPEVAGMMALFNGQGLEGWSGDPRLWSVRDGVIHGETTAATPADGNTFLLWTGGVTKDFELRLSFRCSAENNSGIQYRSRHITDPTVRNPWVVRGYQHELRNESTLPNVAGFIYIQDVDVAKGTVTYLAPRAGPLPGGCLLAGAFKTYLD